MHQPPAFAAIMGIAMALPSGLRTQNQPCVCASITVCRSTTAITANAPSSYWSVRHIAAKPMPRRPNPGKAGSPFKYPRTLRRCSIGWCLMCNSAIRSEADLIPGTSSHSCPKGLALDAKIRQQNQD